MNKFTCTTTNIHNYEIIIERGLKDRLNELTDVFSKYRNMVIITDQNVSKIYGGVIKKQLRAFGGTIYSIVLSPGEQSKSLKTIAMIYEQLRKYNVTSSDLIVSLGGGVVGDIAGFAAATYLRGLDLVQIPTTLLAQVDSSVGGKTGVDIPEGKNLVGAFKQPEAVLIDPTFLETLDDRVLMDGMAEVIKYGCISSSKLFIRLLGYQYQEDLLEDMEDIISKCVQIKRNIVEKDEQDKGLRRILNFGHTIGHVIEAYFNYDTYTHGEAIAIGMYALTKVTVAEGITEKEALDNLRVIFETYGLPYEMPEMDPVRVEQLLSADKKSEGDVINLCIMPKIGKAEIVRMYTKNALKLFQIQKG